ncbi:hypothetical protein [Phenylobacterium sp.]|uniref:hypothetical protein n=1 Tax=Phenylobacterium sp. TaxID=1871053 RepID=UPI0025F075D6|nr:hypothetical protein [Phenylobacterium sp.]
MNLSAIAVLATLGVLILGTPAASAQPQAAPPAGSVTRNLQGGEEDSWIRDPHIHAFYDTVVAAFAQGPAKVDVPALEARAHVIFRDFAVSRGVDPAVMEKHLALIPGQIVKIAREDPTVLDSYDNFVLALFGPK